MATWTEPATWYAQLASIHTTAAGLITDPAGRILLVKPTYHDYWAWPGGWVDDGERPDLACARELREELDLQPQIGPLLVVDWAPPQGERTRPLMAFIFDAGIHADLDAITLDHDELDAWALLTPGEATRRLPRLVAPRVQAALHARHTHTTVYLPPRNAPPE